MHALVRFSHIAAGNTFATAELHPQVVKALGCPLENSPVPSDSGSSYFVVFGNRRRLRFNELWSWYKPAATSPRSVGRRVSNQFHPH
jgi:hypothetical protein